MDKFFEIFNQYARSELFVLIPVLFLLSKIFIASKLPNNKIPIIISTISIILSLLYTFATVNLDSILKIFLALFTSITQGILFSGTSLFGGVLLSPTVFLKIFKNYLKETDEKKEDTKKE